MESLELAPSLSLDHSSLDKIEHSRESSESSSYSTDSAQCQEYETSDLNFESSSASIKTKHNCSSTQYVFSPNDQNFYSEISCQQTQHNKLQSDCNLYEISNPIADSPQYRAYRARQNDRDIRDEKKWPPDLENYFLDAMMDVPHMGRHKFTFDGKPHGRNELIALYIWISYKENLPPDVTPDPLMNRHRKQISSHIQVLKKFMRGHCAFDEMFPSAGAITENGYSFDKNPCLIALSQGRLPSKAYRDQVRYDHNRRINQRQGIIKASPYYVSSLRPFFLSPASSSSIISQPIHIQNYIRDEILDHGLIIVHLCNETLKSVPQWQERFPPLLNMLRSSSYDVLDCEIIHMQVSLDSLFNYSPSNPMEDTTDLKCGFIFPNKKNFESVSETNTDPCYWRSVTALTEPREYYGDPSFSSDTDNDISSIVVEDNRILISIPARQWAAKILSSQRQPSSSCISDDRLYFSHSGIKHYCNSSDIDKTGGDNFSSLIQHHSCEQHTSLSMYQELFFSIATNSGSTTFKRRAIILWSFGYPSNSEKKDERFLSWRYLVPLPHLPSSQLSRKSRCNDSNGYSGDTTLNSAPSFNARVTSTSKNKFDDSKLEQLQTSHFDILSPYNGSLSGFVGVHSNFDYANPPLSTSSDVTIPNMQLHQESFAGLPHHYIPSNYQNIRFEPSKDSFKPCDNDSNNFNALSSHENNYNPYTSIEKVNTEIVEFSPLFPYNKFLPCTSNSKIRFFNNNEVDNYQDWNRLNHVTYDTLWSQPNYHYNPQQGSVTVDDNCLHNDGKNDNAD